MTKEEQRYGRNKNTSISRKYIESGKYRKKFDSISSDEELNRRLYTLSKQMLYHRTGTEFEDMYWIDITSLNIVARILDSKEIGKIRYTPQIQRLVRKNKSLVTVHSHPYGGPPSLNDFNSACENEYLFGVVCGHNGKIFVYRSQEFIPEETYNYLWSIYYEIYRDAYEAQMMTLKSLSASYEIFFKEVL